MLEPSEDQICVRPRRMRHGVVRHEVVVATDWVPGRRRLFGQQVQCVAVIGTDD